MSETKRSTVITRIVLIPFNSRICVEILHDFAGKDVLNVLGAVLPIPLDSRSTEYIGVEKTVHRSQQRQGRRLRSRAVMVRKRRSQTHLF